MCFFSISVARGVGPLLQSKHKVMLLHIKTERVQEMFNWSGKSPFPRQALVLNVPANKRQIIKATVDRLCSMEIPSEKKVIVTGPDPNSIQVGGGVQ